MYSFEYEPASGILRASMRGHWTLAVAKRFSEELDDRILQARRSSPHLRLIVDTTEQGAQCAEVIDYLTEWRKGLARLPSDRIAICPGSAVARMQAERYSDHAQSRIFASVGSARVWLMAMERHRSAA